MKWPQSTPRAKGKIGYFLAYFLTTVVIHGLLGPSSNPAHASTTNRNTIAPRIKYSVITILFILHLPSVFEHSQHNL
jgi:hypothetical protein